MDKAELRQMAAEAAMERVIGSSVIPARHFANLVKAAGRLIEEFKGSVAEWKKEKGEMERCTSELNRALKRYEAELSRLSQIKGEKGDAGYTPVKGKDYFDGVPGRNAKEVDISTLIDAVTMRIRKPEDGKDAQIDYDKLIEMLEDKLELKEHKKKLENEVESYRNQLAGKVYGKDTWARGGGDTVTAGTNVTITVDQAGNKVISAQGGSGGSTISTETVIATDAGGNNVNIDLTQLDNQPWTSIEMVIRNGVIQNKNKWNIVGDTLTLMGAVSTNDFQIQYAYA